MLNHFSCQSAVQHCNSISLYQSNIQYHHQPLFVVRRSSSGDVSPAMVFEDRPSLSNIQYNHDHHSLSVKRPCFLIHNRRNPTNVIPFQTKPRVRSIPGDTHHAMSELGTQGVARFSTVATPPPHLVSEHANSRSERLLRSMSRPSRRPPRCSST